MKKLTPLVLCGAGGIGQEFAWVVERLNQIEPTFDLLGFCDDDAEKKGATVYGYKVLGTPQEVDRALDKPPAFLCSICNTRIRKEVVGRVAALGWRPASLVDPSVIVAKGVEVGQGTYVGAGSILSPYARIGRHVIINHHCSIGHDSRLDDFVLVNPGGRVSGYATLGRGAVLSTNAVIPPGGSVGALAVLGASSFAVRGVPENTTAVGVPARTIMKRKRSK